MTDLNNNNALDASPAIPAGGNVDSRTPIPAPATRVRKTHKPETINHISALSLRAKLTINNKIELRNEAREVKRWEWRSNPQGDEPDSDNESVITIPEEDLICLEDPSIHDSMSPILPLFVKDELAKRKRRRESDAGRNATQTSDAPQENHIDKRRCVDGFLTKDVPLRPVTELPISQLYYDTADAKIFIPLHLFTSSALQYVMRYESEIVQDSKSIRNVKVLDVKSLSKVLNTNEESPSFTYQNFTNAANNMVRFQTSRDKHGDQGPWAMTWWHHFQFFITKPDAGETFLFWRSNERKLRLDLWHQVRGFNQLAYEQVYLLAETFGISLVESL